MTRDEQRKACIKAMRYGYIARVAAGEWELEDLMIATLDALNGIATVCLLGTTADMMGAGQSAEEDGSSLGWIYRAMAAVGDLTNPPEVKP